MSKKVIGYIILVKLILIGVAILLFGDTITRTVFAPTDTSIENITSDGDVSIKDEVIVRASQLSVPWAVEPLHDGTILATERTGNLLHIPTDGSVTRISVPDVESTGEGGLLGVVTHPSFETNRLIYLYVTHETDIGVRNRVMQYRFMEGVLDHEKIIIDAIPGARYHDGGQLAIGPDAKLYVTTGDAGEGDMAQDKDSLAGKILRLNLDGSIPQDNPFDSAVYSFGHRNPQGLAWDDEGQLWSSEHGRSGVKSGFDELNKIIEGGNYGWPVIQGDEEADDMITPVVHSGPDDTWAPASLAFVEGTFYWGGLRGQALYAADKIGNNSVGMVRMYFREEYGRLRAVVPSLDNGSLYITTSNTDGRGKPLDGDDKIIEISL